MNLLKEKDEKRSRKEERENQQQQQQQHQRAREGLAVHKLSAEALRHGMTCKDLVAAANAIGMNAGEVNGWLRYMESVGWTFSNGAPVNGRNFRRPLRMWHMTERRLAAERGSSGPSPEEQQAKKEAERLEAAAEPASWTLCNERCAFAEDCGCAKKHLIPPQLRAYPIAPEDCKGFKPKEVA